MDLQTIRATALRRYGLDGSVEDDLFNNTVMKEIINEKHKWFAGTTLCYQEEIEVVGTSLINNNDQWYLVLDDDVIEILPLSLRVIDGSTWRRVVPRYYHSLLQQYTTLESVARGVPTSFYVRPGIAAASNRMLGLLPGPNTTIAALATEAFRYLAYVYPPDLSSDTDAPPLPSNEHHRLIPAVCWGMAELEATRGRTDAPVQLWLDRAVAAAEELAEIIRRGTRELPRTASVGASPLADAEERRGSRIGLKRG